MLRPLLPCLASAVALSSTLFAHDAKACSLPEGGLGLVVPDRVPEAGVLFIPVVCAYECEHPEDLTLTVTREGGEEVQGSRVSAAPEAGAPWVAWRPEVPFEQGMYSVEFEHPDKRPNQEAQAFEVTSDPVASAAELTIEPWSYARVTGPDACCVEGTIDSCGGSSCYTIPEGVTSFINLSLKYGEASPYGLPGGFVYRARAQGGEWPSFWNEWRGADVIFEGEASEYCYEVEAYDLRNSTSEIIFSGCAPGSEVPPVDQEAELTRANRELFSQCSVPPEGYEDRWCETFAENVRTGSCEGKYQAACEAAQERCPELPNNPDGSGGSQNSSGGSRNGSSGSPNGSGGMTSASSGGHGPEGSGEDLNDDGEPTGSDDSDESTSERNVRGCSYSSSSLRTSPSWLFAVLGALWLVSGRRRSSSASFRRSDS